MKNKAYLPLIAVFTISLLQCIGGEKLFAQTVSTIFAYDPTGIVTTLPNGSTGPTPTLGNTNSSLSLLLFGEQVYGDGDTITYTDTPSSGGTATEEALTADGINGVEVELTNPNKNGSYELGADSSYTDAITFTANNGLPPGDVLDLQDDTVQYTFDVAVGDITRFAEAELSVSSLEGTEQAAIGVPETGSVGGSTDVIDYASDAGDEFNLYQGDYDATLTTQPYEVAGNPAVGGQAQSFTITPTVDLSALISDTSGYPGVSLIAANIFNTVQLENISVFDDSGNEIPLSDFTIIDASGTAYAFGGGNAVAPETSSWLGLTLLFGLAFGVRIFCARGKYASAVAEIAE
jgi:hypothetical protein